MRRTAPAGSSTGPSFRSPARAGPACRSSRRRRPPGRVHATRAGNVQAVRVLNRLAVRAGCRGTGWCVVRKATFGTRAVLNVAFRTRAPAVVGVLFGELWSVPANPREPRAEAERAAGGRRPLSPDPVRTGVGSTRGRRARSSRSCPGRHARARRLRRRLRRRGRAGRADPHPGRARLDAQHQPHRPLRRPAGGVVRRRPGSTSSSCPTTTPRRTPSSAPAPRTSGSASRTRSPTRRRAAPTRSR